MIKKKKKIIIISLFIIAISIFIFIIGYLVKDDNKYPSYRIAYIADSSRKENIKFVTEGISQAAKDMKVEANVYTLLDDGSVEEQISILTREREGGVDAIVLSPTDYNKLGSLLEDIYKDIPVILISSNVKNDSNIPFIECNNVEVGKALASEVVKDGNTRKKIGIITTEVVSSRVSEMYNGFTSEIALSSNSCYNMELSGGRETYYEQINDFINSNNIDVIIAFNREVLEIVVQSKQDNMLNIEVYGCGVTNKILSFLEEGLINSIAVQNEFNLGYLGVEMAVNKLNNKSTINKTIDFSIINKRNMYWDENQKILFPFIK